MVSKRRLKVMTGKVGLGSTNVATHKMEFGKLDVGQPIHVVGGGLGLVVKKKRSAK